MKTFYVFRRQVQNITEYLTTNDKRQFTSVEEDNLFLATHFDSVSDAIDGFSTSGIHTSFKDHWWKLYRVSETAGTEHRRVLDDWEGCTKGETVKYALFHRANSRYYGTNTTEPRPNINCFVCEVDNCDVFDDALSASVAYGYWVIEHPTHFRVDRIAVSYSPVSYTETEVV